MALDMPEQKPPPRPKRPDTPLPWPNEYWKADYIYLDSGFGPETPELNGDEYLEQRHQWMIVHLGGY